MLFNNMMDGPIDRLKSLAIREASHVQGFMNLLMKPHNGVPWSDADKTELRAHLRHLARSLPAFGIFTLPGGSLLLPFLALFLDRRSRRNAESSDPAIPKAERETDRSNPTKSAL